MIRKLSIFLFILCTTNDFAISKSVDGRRIYHDISSGQGLYKSGDKVHILGASNFVDQVHNSASAWLVEFYNSWCGHCIQFAPTWKDFSASVASWSHVVKVGAVDCSNEANSDLCREYEIMKYPTLRYFAPQTAEGKYGVETDKSYNVEGLKKKLIKKLLIEQAKNTSIVQTWPVLSSYNSNNVFDVWSELPAAKQYAIFFVEETPKDDEEHVGFAGMEFILDLSSVTEVYATRVVQGSPPAQQLRVDKAPKVVVVTRGNDIIPLTPTLDTRTDRLMTLIRYLKLQGISVHQLEPEDENVRKTVNAGDVIDVIQEEMNRPDQGDIVYQIDLETALRYSLERDVPLKYANIKGDRLDALRAYINVLTKYFPFDSKGRQFLKSLKASVDRSQSFSPSEFKTIASSIASTHDPYLMKHNAEAYIGCNSRLPGLRRFPCSLWTLFHTLTIAAESKPELATDPKEVLHAMQGYIKHFFSCSECANNFAKETGNLNEMVNSLNDSILYLWKTHNHVNHRLHQFPGNLTEDPDHPKIQFPSSAHCPQCYTSSGDWNETAVLSYLKNMYTKISYKAVAESAESSPAPLLHSQNKRHVSRHEMTPLVIDTRYFNVFDISLCVLLYFASAAILILVGLKFFLRKSHIRKKNFIYDVLRKA